jgi:hypothetical protein
MVPLGVEVTLRLTVSRSVCLGVEPTLGLDTRYYFLSEGSRLKVAVFFLWGALSDERTGLQFAVQSLKGSSRAEPLTILYCLIWDLPNLEGQVPVFISPRNRVAQFYPRARVCNVRISTYFIKRCNIIVVTTETAFLNTRYCYRHTIMFGSVDLFVCEITGLPTDFYQCSIW